MAGLLLAAFVAAGCNKTDTPPARPAKPRVSADAGSTRQATTPAAPEAQVDEALKERLARQDAAVRMFEKKNETNVLSPPPPRSAISMAAPEAPPPPAPTPAVVPAEAKPAPVVAAAPPPSPVIAAAPKASVAAPPVELAKAAPAKPAPVSRETRLVSRVEPDFPPEAVRAGVVNGTVRARMTLDGAGQVTRVEIMEANPRRLFDRSVTRALSQWRFSDGDDGRSVESEIAFRR